MGGWGEGAAVGDTCLGLRMLPVGDGMRSMHGVGVAVCVFCYNAHSLHRPLPDPPHLWEQACRCQEVIRADQLCAPRPVEQAVHVRQLQQATRCCQGLGQEVGQLAAQLHQVTGCVGGRVCVGVGCVVGGGWGVGGAGAEQGGDGGGRGRSAWWGGGGRAGGGKGGSGGGTRW